MNTPLKCFRNKKKLRLESFNTNIFPQKQYFSLESSTRRQKTQQSFHKCLQTHRVQSVKSQSIQKKNNLQINIEEEKYQIIIKKTLRKVSNHSLSMSKNGLRLQQIFIDNKIQSDKNKNIFTERIKCGNDLIKLSRRKLQQMIFRISRHSTVKNKNYELPEFIIQKCKINKLKTQSRSFERQIKPQIKHKSITHCDSYYLQYNRERNVKADKLKSNNREQKQQKLDLQQFLVCSQVPIFQQQNSIKKQCQIMISNIPKGGFIRQNKKKNNSQSASKKQRKQIDEGLTTSNIFSLISKRQCQSLEQSCKNESFRKQLSPRKMNHTDGFKLKNQKIINAFNFSNSKGWDSPSQESNSFLLIHPNF